VLSALGTHTPGFLIAAAITATLVVTLTRFAWMFIAGGLARSFGERVVIAWSGMRGAVSLAAALSVPLSAHGRPLILFLTYAVIIGTIVPQGLTLPAVVRRFAPEDTDASDAREERARVEAVRAALDRLSTLEAEGDAPQEALDEARRRYELRLRHLTSEDTDEHRIVPATREVQRELADAEREALHRLSQDGELDAETARRLERELDLQDARWGTLEHSRTG
jgi:CPA1 family monovalent cation:H+ antiporter